jgi:hypothetical protein
VLHMCSRSQVSSGLLALAFMDKDDWSSIKRIASSVILLFTESVNQSNNSWSYQESVLIFEGEWEIP